MTTAAAATDKPFDMLDALAEGFQSKVDATEKTVTAQTSELTVPRPLTIQNVVLAALTEHTGSLWVMPRVGGIPFTGSPSIWPGGETIKENPPILRLRDATMELVADPEKTGKENTYQIRIIHGRTRVFDALSGILIDAVIKTIILPYYSEEPAESPSDHYYFRSNRRNLPCFALFYSHWWNSPPLQNPPIAPYVQRIKEAMVKKGAAPYNTSPHFKGVNMPWIQHDAECDRVIAHVVINTSEFLLVNHFDLDSVQQYAITTTGVQHGTETIAHGVNAIGAYETTAIRYVRTDPRHKYVNPSYSSVVEQYEKAVVPAAPTPAATATTMTVGTLNNKGNL